MHRSPLSERLEQAIMDVATHFHFFVNFQVFEWLNHVSLVKIDVLLLIIQNHAGVDDLIIVNTETCIQSPMI